MSSEEQPVKSVGGWIVMVTGVHAEAQEEDVRDAFEGFGQITSVHLNLDRRSGYAKGYALLEFVEEEDARKAVENMNGQQLLGQEVAVSWVFKKAPASE
ncbi:RNA recognition motif domain containing protein, putative [Babesia bigemina]|uniref:RNA recognition motif domain containing protein, putative n=1 Tax=Babesia bigemina TaxID=5866 RepID=A0A061DDP0_BABBI|nr:RNA recognition motif domain containing protein, putative [Babesia bigemina]CDR96430.1 RNA recognition motif domain containing protein, putative [Babesia bigemina]|eukprot:XP_012768616.1 RNA recognition motif domain containing protein, putative [Babesia bigemina]